MNEPQPNPAFAQGPTAAKQYALAISIVVVSLLWVGGVVSWSGQGTPERESSGMRRFCAGQCICDGGVTDRPLMSRVCPKGWQRAYGVARRKKVRLRKRMRQLKKLLRPQPNTVDTIPNV